MVLLVSLIMHFYDWNIGDYAKKTQHLTNDEDLAYRRLLDMYYDAEQPITHGLATLSRRLRIDEKSIKNVLDEFFPAGVNKHADEKIVEYHTYLEKQKSNGSKGGRPKHKPTANPPLTQNNPVPSQPLTTKPLTTNHEPLNTKQGKSKPLSEDSDDFPEPLKNKPEKQTFSLPGWIDKKMWDLWMQTRKGKKMIPAQMQAQVDKLSKWRDAGLDFATALSNAALGGYQGIFLPDTNKQGGIKTPAPDNFAAKDYGQGISDL